MRMLPSHRLGERERLVRKRVGRWIKLVLGWTFVVLGVLGLFLPVLQGVLFLAIGFTILANESPWADRQLNRARRRFPKHAETFDNAKDRAANWIKRRNSRT